MPHHLLHSRPPPCSRTHIHFTGSYEEFCFGEMAGGICCSLSTSEDLSVRPRLPPLQKGHLPDETLRRDSWQ